MPAGLVKLLLLMAGIEPNPGPTWICPVCTKKVYNHTISVECTKCHQWVHCRKINNCSNLKSYHDYDNTSYICSGCLIPQTSSPAPPTLTPATTTNPPVNTPSHTPQSSNHQNLLNSTPYELLILQWNCNGLKSKYSELVSYLYQHQLKIAVIQESKLSCKSTTIDIPNFATIRKDRTHDNGGGLIIYVHKSLQFQILPDRKPDEHTEYLGILVGDTHIINIYIPPTSSCKSGFKPDINTILPSGDALVLGDFNAHDPLWHSSIQDPRGSEIADTIGNSNFGVLNENTPTRLPSNGNATSPDISLASISLMNSIEWKTMTSLGSDHLPIIIKVSTHINPIKSDFRSFINFEKADWNRFTAITEEKFDDLVDPTEGWTVHSAEKKFRNIINKAAKKTIPGGRIKDVIPEIPTATAAKIKRRDEIRTNDPHSPEIANLNRDIYIEISKHRKSKWREKVEGISKSCSNKLFKLIKNLNGKSTQSGNQAIRFKGKYLSSARDIANGFNKQFSSVVKHKSSKQSRIISRKIKKNEISDDVTFTYQDTDKAIKQCKASKAAGPDNITNLHLKHLGPNGIAFLTKIFNISVSTSTIPDIWKNSVIIPLLKPGKPANISDSYRPVSLLCPAIKILERLLLPTLTENLEVPVFQHGFRKNHSTVTALNEFNSQVANGFNEKRSKRPDRTVLLQIDLSKAFDMVNHDKLLKDLESTNLSPCLKRWFCCYLKGRQSTVNFRNQTSKHRNIRAGVPQGAVTSPILFNFYLRHLPRPPKNIQVVQYADDISIYATGKPFQNLASAINQYIPKVLEFLEERELQVSPTKSTVTLFTPDTKEFKEQPEIKMKDCTVPHEHTPKLLGVTFDTMYTFSHHVKNITDTAKSKINIMKCLAGSSWGQDTETLAITYKSICRSVLEYAAPIWSPIISDTSWLKLQTTQNQALRVITGNLGMASTQHLHREAKILPLKDHCRMITNQFLLTNHLPDHPGFKLTTEPLPSRSLKPTIQHSREDIAHLLPVDKDDLKAKIKIIHTTEVQKALAQYPPNKILQRNPPEVNKEEVNLPRITRSRLSQLRSGYSRILNSYLHRIGEKPDDSCTLCNQSPHTTLHLFECPNNPTNLDVLSLWTQPKMAADFLQLDEGIT
jgi:hypothetical protein